MIKVSEMYRISGGCKIGNTCSECANHISEKNLTCIVYPKSYGIVWSGKRLACKYFWEKSNDGQMDISDLLKEKWN